MSLILYNIITTCLSDTYTNLVARGVKEFNWASFRPLRETALHLHGENCMSAWIM